MTEIDSATDDGDEADERHTSVSWATRATAVSAGIGACALLAAAFAILAVAALATGSVVAGDNVAIFRPDPAELEAEPGEEVAVDVVMTSHGGYDDVGVVSVDFVARYHPAYLEVVDVEAGPWLEQGNETDVRRSTTVANDDGVTILEQRRDPPAGGATGEAVLATLTFRVADDVDPAQATVDFVGSEVVLESQFRQPIHDRNVSVTIAGGDERPEGYDHPPLEDVGEGSGPDGGSNSSPDGSAGSSDGAGGDGAGTDSASPSGDEGENDTTGSSGGDGGEATGSPGATNSSEGAGGDGDSSDANEDPTPGFTTVVAAGTLGIVLVALSTRWRRG